MKTPFKYLAAWQKLRFQPKWDSQTINQHNHPPPDPPPDLLPSPDENQDESTSSRKHNQPDDSGERPIGGKASKKQRLVSKKTATEDSSRVEAITAFTAVATRQAVASEGSNWVSSNLMRIGFISKDLEIS